MIGSLLYVQFVEISLHIVTVVDICKIVLLCLYAVNKNQSVDVEMLVA